jgi:hypothetical protein
MFGKISCLLGSIVILLLSGCGQKEYYDAVKAQNITINSMNIEKHKSEQLAEARHEERMLVLIKSSMTAAAGTPEKTDDVLVPLLIMSIEDKRVMAHALTANSNKQMQLHIIKAPETFGEAVQKSTSAILGVGAIVSGIIQSNNLTDVATAGISSAGTTNTISGEGNSITNDSYKTGSQNTVTGDSNKLSSGDMSTLYDSPTTEASEEPEEIVEEPIEEPAE